MVSTCLVFERKEISLTDRSWNVDRFTRSSKFIKLKRKEFNLRFRSGKLDPERINFQLTWNALLWKSTWYFWSVEWNGTFVRIFVFGGKEGKSRRRISKDATAFKSPQFVGMRSTLQWLHRVTNMRTYRRPQGYIDRIAARIRLSHS